MSNAVFYLFQNSDQCPLSRYLIDVFDLRVTTHFSRDKLHYMHRIIWGSVHGKNHKVTCGEVVVDGGEYDGEE